MKHEESKCESVQIWKDEVQDFSLMEMETEMGHLVQSFDFDILALP